MVEFLEKKPLLHRMMIESTRRGNAEVLRDRPDGVMLRDRPSRVLMLAAENEGAAREMLDAAGDFPMLALHDEFTLAQARGRFRATRFMTLVQAVYPGKSIDLLPADIRPLAISDFDFVREHYNNIDDEEYVAERITSGEIYGVYQDGALAGFMGTHQEGSLGLLEVLPEYRRRGLAEALERHVVNVHLARGWTPFAQISPDNEASIALHEKMGFEISTERLYWLY